MTSFSVDAADLEKNLTKYAQDVAIIHMYDAATKAAEIIAKTYRAILANVQTKPGGKNFSIASAEEAITFKVGHFPNLLGVWYVVGPAVSKGKMLAPQLQFGENGTVDRYTKSGAHRGIEPAQHWLERAALMSQTLAKDAAMKRMVKLVN